MSDSPLLDPDARRAAIRRKNRRTGLILGLLALCFLIAIFVERLRVS